MPRLLKILILIILIIPAGHLPAQEYAKISASNLLLEETDDGITLTLEGPVEIIYGNDILTSDSATVILAGDLSSLEDALESAELTGNVTYTGAGSVSAGAGRATYYAQSGRVVLTDRPSFSRGSLSVTSGSVEYRIASRFLNLSGGCTISESPLTASANSANYDLTEKTGNLTGDVEIRYAYGADLFGEGIVDEVIMNSDALFVSVADMLARTPDNASGSRTTITAGNFTLAANSISFAGSESGLTLVEAGGNVVMEGPERSLRAASITLNSSEGVIRADGGVEFSIYGQDGSADSIDVNFKEHWSIRLTGGSVGGEIDETTLDNGDEGAQETSGEPE